ncbi:MAG: hypothetical protein HQK67_04810 [Desulfamplus sp.]|nr:hypothetical protein [Desulfamplus sp.]
MKLNKLISLYFFTILFFITYFNHTVSSEPSRGLNSSDKRYKLSNPDQYRPSNPSDQYRQPSSPSDQYRPYNLSEQQSKYTTTITFGIYPNRKSKALAKQNATNNALKEAVEKSIIRMMSRIEITSNLNLIYDAVHNNAEKFIVTYKILGEVVKKENSIVAVESLINLEALTQFLNQKGSQKKNVGSNDQIPEKSLYETKEASTEKNSGFKTIKAKIEGSDYLSSFIMLRKTLNSMNGIKDVQTRELTSEQATVTILFNGDGKYLAHELTQNTFDDFRLELSDITDESLTIRFVLKTNGTPIEKTDMEGAYISE